MILDERFLNTKDYINHNKAWLVAPLVLMTLGLTGLNKVHADSNMQSNLNDNSNQQSKVVYNTQPKNVNINNNQTSSNLTSNSSSNENSSNSNPSINSLSSSSNSLDANRLQKSNYNSNDNRIISNDNVNVGSQKINNNRISKNQTNFGNAFISEPNNTVVKNTQKPKNDNTFYNVSNFSPFLNIGSDNVSPFTNLDYVWSHKGSQAYHIAKELYDFDRFKLGLDPKQAAAAVGNPAGGEDRNLNPTQHEINSPYNGKGLFQFTGGTRTAYENWAERHKSKYGAQSIWNPRVQAAGIFAINGPYTLSLYKHRTKHDSIDEATYYFCENIERPGKYPHLAWRYEAAHEAYKLFHNDTPNGSGDTPKVKKSGWHSDTKSTKAANGGNPYGPTPDGGHLMPGGKVGPAFSEHSNKDGSVTVHDGNKTYTIPADSPDNPRNMRPHEQSPAYSGPTGDDSNPSGNNQQPDGGPGQTTSGQPGSGSPAQTSGASVNGSGNNQNAATAKGGSGSGSGAAAAAGAAGTAGGAGGGTAGGGAVGGTGGTVGGNSPAGNGNNNATRNGPDNNNITGGNNNGHSSNNNGHSSNNTPGFPIVNNNDKDEKSSNNNNVLLETMANIKDADEAEDAQLAGLKDNDTNAQLNQNQNSQIAEIRNQSNWQSNYDSLWNNLNSASLNFDTQYKTDEFTDSAQMQSMQNSLNQNEAMSAAKSASSNGSFMFGDYAQLNSSNSDNNSYNVPDNYNFNRNDEDKVQKGTTTDNKSSNDSQNMQNGIPFDQTMPAFDSFLQMPTQQNQVPVTYSDSKQTGKIDHDLNKPKPINITYTSRKD